MALTTDAASTFLLKQFLNVPSNKPDQSYFAESEMNFSNYVLQETLFLEAIPDSPDISNISPPTEYGLTAGTDYTSYGIDVCMGTVEYFEELVLEKVNDLRTPSSWYRADASGNSLLRDALQYNYKAVGTSYPYNYELYVDGVSIGRSNTDYKWMFDIKSGYITFFGNTVPESGEAVTLSFYRYNGLKGLTHIDQIVNDIRSGQFIEYLTKQPPVLTDNSANTSYTEGVIDIHWMKGTDYDVSYQLSTSGLVLPHIDTVHIDISSSSAPSTTVKFATLPADASNHQLYYGDSSGGLTLDETQTYTIAVYGENQSDDLSFHILRYRDISFDDTVSLPASIPVLTYDTVSSAVTASETVLVNGIPSVRVFSVDISLSVDPISTLFQMRNRATKTEYATLTLADPIAYQEQISEDICGGAGVQLFYAQEGDTSANLHHSVFDIYPGSTLYSDASLSVFSFTAYNVKGESTPLDISFSPMESFSAWWVDASSVELDGSGALTTTIRPEGRNTFDISIGEITRNEVDVSIVDISMWDYTRTDASAIENEGQLLFVEGRFCGAGYTSSLLGGSSVYRDWTDISGPDYSGLATSGLTDVIRNRGYDGGAPVYKWCAKRFANIVTDASGRFRIIRIDGETRETWPSEWRVYAIQFLYSSSYTGDPLADDANYVDRTTWMDTRAYLSSRISEYPYRTSVVDGYGCAYDTTRIALKLNPRKGHKSTVYVLVGIPNTAPPNQSFFSTLTLDVV